MIKEKIMKMIRFVIFAVVTIAGLFLMSSKAYSIELVYRPVTLTVLDAETNQPLEGITVTVTNVLFYSKTFWLLFIPIDSWTDSVHHTYRYTTNENGVVEIPQFVYKVDRYHSLDRQIIVLNIELLDTSIDAYEQGFVFKTAYSYSDDRRVIPLYRVRPEYKGGFISCNTSIPSYQVQKESGKPYMTVINKVYQEVEGNNIQTSFLCGHEEFVFYLERFEEP